MKRRCISCGRPAVAGRSRCSRHGPTNAARHGPNPYDHGWQVKAKAAVAEHVAIHGWMCPGYGVPAHRSTDLTGDHARPLSLGGTNDGVVAVLCRRCNTRKGGRNRLKASE